MTVQTILRETLIWIELLAALIAVWHWPNLKESHWKWFVVYLGVIFMVEAFSKWGLKNQPTHRVNLYDFFGIPIQFLFFYWLYAVKSLKNYGLFWISIAIYGLSFLPYFTLFNKEGIVFSLSYTVGNVLLLLMVFLEIFKQIKSEKILLFRSNFMFYINIGITLFYIGTLPFFSFYGLILKDLTFWTSYYIFFMIANHIMYVLFICAFVWGKPNTY